MNNHLLQLQEKESISVEEALNFSQQIAKKYLVLLKNIINIRNAHPTTEDEPIFRAKGARKNSETSEIYETLQELEQAFLRLEQEWTLNNNESKPDPLEIKTRILEILSKAIESYQEIYQQHSKRFAMIEEELAKLYKLIELKLPPQNNERNIAKNSQFNAEISNNQIDLKTDEKVVFVRIFNKNMVALKNQKDDFNWIKPLLDSVKLSEKHGLAIYATEEEVKKSLKGDNYGYVTLKINQEQDISASRSPKFDNILGSKLLTISPVELKNIVRLNYCDTEYWIDDGVLKEKNTDK